MGVDGLGYRFFLLEIRHKEVCRSRPVLAEAAGAIADSLLSSRVTARLKKRR